jgi:hypothetical protein
MALTFKNAAKLSPVYKNLTTSAIVLACLSTASLNADAQTALETQSAQAAYTPIGQTNGNEGPNPLIFASLVSPASSRPPVTSPVSSMSPMPRFSLVEAAGRYSALVREADRMANLPSFSRDAIAQALHVTSQTSVKGISEGAGAYAAQVAANHGEFASSLRTTVNLLGRDAVLARLKSDPEAFLALVSGSKQASQNASGALAASTSKLARAETILGEAAYSVQTQSWSQQVVDTPAALAAHRQAAQIPLDRADFTTQAVPVEPSDAPINGRYLLAASYQILGDDAAATQVLDKPLGRTCMNRVQLNVRQCLAASQYPYEHLFCLSKHSFGETNGCVKDAVK